MKLQQAKNKIEQCYDSRNWLCIAWLIVQFGRVIYDYLQLIIQQRKEKSNDKAIEPAENEPAGTNP